MGVYVCVKSTQHMTYTTHRTQRRWFRGGVHQSYVCLTCSIRIDITHGETQLVGKLVSSSLHASKMNDLTTNE